MLGIGLSVPQTRGGVLTPLVFSWRPTSATTAWATDGNWLSNRVPANNTSTNTAIFAQTSYTQQPNAGTRSIASVQIGDGATATAALTLSGTSLTVGASGISMLANAASSTISCPIALGVNATLSNASANSLTISGAISGAFGVTRSGSGPITISGTSSYSGTTTFSGGVTTLTGNLGNTNVTVTGATLSGATASLGTVSIGGSLTASNTAGTIIRAGSNGDNTLVPNDFILLGSNAQLTIDCATTTTSQVTPLGTCALGGCVINVQGTLNAGAFNVISSAGAMTGTLPTLGTNATGRGISFAQVGNNITMTAV